VRCVWRLEEVECGFSGVPLTVSAMTTARLYKPEYRAGLHNFFAIAGRITFTFMNYDRQWLQVILYFALLLFCFHTLRLTCFHTFVWPSFCSVLCTHTEDKEFLIMHRHHTFHILNYIIMCTAASIFIEGHMRPYGLCLNEITAKFL